MKIGQRRSKQTSRPVLSPTLRWLGALLLAFVVGLVAGHQGWHRALQDLGAEPARLARSLFPPGDGELPTLMVDMDFASYTGILDQRDQALQTGVYIPAGGDFVTGTIRLDDSAVPVRVRLQGGPGRHLGEDEKWNFELRTRQNRQLLGMQRFYLLDPADNNGLNQWAFARALEREGVLAARYRFVRLIFNGDDRGIYALQEGFGSELPSAQGRPEGVIVRFDADLLWESIAHFGGDAPAAYADPVANLSAADFQYFEVDAFRDAAIARDPELSAQRERAIGLLRALQTGELAASEAFDVERYGRFLALVDLWGAEQATSLVNLHYYYNPASGKLEPIGFSADPLGSDGRLSLAATYDDPALQAATAREAARLGRPEYLDKLQAELEPELRRLQQALRSSAGGADLGNGLDAPWDELRRRQEQIRRSLDPVQPVFAYLGPPTLATSGTLRLDVGNVLNLPVEVVGFDVNGALFLPAERRWLREADQALVHQRDAVVLRALDPARAPVIRYVRFAIPLTEIHRADDEIDFVEEPDVQVVTRILGLPTTQMTLAREGYPEVFVVGGDE